MMNTSSSFLDTQQQKQRKVSPFAATEIGQGGGAEDRAHYKRHFREEAGQVTEYLRGVHHARKLGFMQVNYADTVNKLSKAQENVSVMLPPAHLATQAHNPTVSTVTSKNTQQDALNFTQYQQQMNEHVSRESQLNLLKRYHNREVGRKAIATEVMAGTAPMPKAGLGGDIFPQRCTHTQVLAMTGKLCMPSPHTVPAAPLPRKKWLGEGEGWSATPRNSSTNLHDTGGGGGGGGGSGGYGHGGH